MTILQYSGDDWGRAGRGRGGRGNRYAASAFARTSNKWERSSTPSSSLAAAAASATSVVTSATKVDAIKKGNISWKRVSEKAALPTETPTSEPKGTAAAAVLLSVDADVDVDASDLQPDTRDASETAEDARKDKKGPILKGPSNFNPQSNRIKHPSMPHSQYTVNYSKKGKRRRQPQLQPQPKTAKRIRLMQNNSKDSCAEDFPASEQKQESMPPQETPTNSTTTTFKTAQPPQLTNCAYRATSTATGLVRVPPPSNARVCAKFARGLDCTNPHCRDRHDLPHPECALPYCFYFQRQGMCLRTDCPFRHIKVNPRATLCPSFVALGYCPDTECAMKHESTTTTTTTNTTGATAAAAVLSKTKSQRKSPPQLEARHNTSRSDITHQKKKTPNMSWRKAA